MHLIYSLEAVKDELSLMLRGEGRYRHGSAASAPSLRFLAFISLCPDNNYNMSESNDITANITKAAARQCVSSLRRACEAASLQCRAISRAAEQNFEKKLKMMLMPEYSVPYAFHLLALRPETPYDGIGVLSSTRREPLEREETGFIADEGDYEALKKRLKWLFQPLVMTLGNSPENITFLLRQTEILGHKYRPIDVMNTSTEAIEDDGIFLAKLKVVCSLARQVLLQFVKKDIKLSRYPGVIQIPSTLFTRVEKLHSKIEVLNIPVVSQPERIGNEDNSDESNSPYSTMDQTVDTKSPSSKMSNGASPDSSDSDGRDQENALSINLSPIPQSRSPMSSIPIDESVEKELGHGKGRTKRPRDTIISPSSCISGTTSTISKFSSSTNSVVSTASKRSRKISSPSNTMDSGKTSLTSSPCSETGPVKRKSSSTNENESNLPDVKSPRRRSRRLQK